MVAHQEQAQHCCKASPLWELVLLLQGWFHNHQRKCLSKKWWKKRPWLIGCLLLGSLLKYRKIYGYWIRCPIHQIWQGPNLFSRRPLLWMWTVEKSCGKRIGKTSRCFINKGDFLSDGYVIGGRFGARTVFGSEPWNLILAVLERVLTWVDVPLAGTWLSNMVGSDNGRWIGTSGWPEHGLFLPVWIRWSSTQYDGIILCWSSRRERWKHFDGRDITRASVAASYHPNMLVVANAPYWRADLDLEQGKERVFNSTNKMLWRKVDWLVAKTGYTNTARACFTGVYEHKGRRIAITTLGAWYPSRRWKDVNALMNGVATH